MFTKFYISIYKRGPEHPLLEHPDKDGNLPLMHSCAKLDIGSVTNFSHSLKKILLFFSFRKVELLVKAGANVNNYISSGKTAYVFLFTFILIISIKNNLV